jgi:phosphatidate cytidylyltransferase
MLKQRILTAVLLAPLAIAGVLGLSTPWFALVLGALCAAGLVEWARLVGLRSLPAQLALMAGNVALMLLLWFWPQRDEALRIEMFLGVAWWPLAALWLRHFSFGQALARRNQSIKALAGSLIVVPAWAAGVLLHGSGGNGPRWVLFVLVLIWCADVFAYFAGRRYGTTKLAPRVSPGKTRAGLYGALIGSALYAAVAGVALGHSDGALFVFVLLSVVTVGVSVVGDLFESLIKRHSNVKDSGNIFPGHGGVLDRLDSLFAALPVFVAGKLLFQL